jgi:hypothetical protein
LLERLLIDNIWLAVILWCVIYTSDYYLTIYSARLYHASAKDYMVFEGSFELTPAFQDDVDRLRYISPRFLKALLVSCAGIVIVWWLSVQFVNLPALYSFLIGALVLREAAIHARHARNITSFKHAKGGYGIKGKVEYSRPYILKASAVDLFSFAALFLFLFLVSGSWFCLGGAMACGVTGRQHQALAKKTISNIQQVTSIQSE